MLISPIQVVVSRRLMSSLTHLFLEMAAHELPAHEGPTHIFHKKSLMSSLLASWYMNPYQDVSKLLKRHLFMSDFLLEK